MFEFRLLESHATHSFFKTDVTYPTHGSHQYEITYYHMRARLEIDEVRCYLPRIDLSSVRSLAPDSHSLKNMHCAMLLQRSHAANAPL